MSKSTFYPKQFTGQNNNGTISTVSNTGRIVTINLYLGENGYGTKIDNTCLSYDSDYGNEYNYGSGK
jgi:hypothetical protein